jgi:hypothetical protein
VRPKHCPWPWWYIALWSVALVLACAWQGPRFLRGLRPTRDHVTDFFQEWSSARFHCDGLPVYTPQEEGLRRYLGRQRDRDSAFNEVNAHPPTSVLLALPLAGLNYADACLAWNLLSLAALAASLGLVVHGLKLSLPLRAILPFFTLLLLCYPLRKQVDFVQLNLMLLLLLVGAWSAERSGRPGWAGALVGTAAAIKLFPAYLFLYFLLRRQWRAVLAGVAIGLLWTALTVLVLGPDSYRDYAGAVLPHLAQYRAAWPNASLTGFWEKLLVGGRTLGHTLPLWHSPLAARLAAGACGLAVTAVVAGVVWRARSQAECDRAFGVAVTGMLLVSPITWDHYFLLLLLPAVLLALTLRGAGVRWYALCGCLIVLWLTPELYYRLAAVFHPAGAAAQPWQTLTVLSLQTYALAGLFLLGATSVQDAEAYPAAAEQGDGIGPRAREYCQALPVTP